ncbi:DUF4062 domain-containing protein [Paracoccus sp. pheM1]|uniref:DUF4062 domain-containing protein n=1 Tax=Paracoccus sp. pheM1 TaxID=2831675 RepID=UPI001BDB885E|nr:DUF4062 domain-containing protein [Paracoccus sp. pheM1]MBT0779349.1 DUF4062 domain-containing protein [Paracoccus sp. pheM1]
MHDKRYSVFISSTFEDLKAERQAVQDVVISAGDFPVQMESFPAADEDQFEFIKALIDKCDYYVLIVAGRYGAPAEDGMSYTEKEYRYAVSKGVPVLVMLHGDQGSIPANKSENSAEGKKRLAAFVTAVETNRLRKTWVTPDGLKLAVREALEHAKATKPAVGWVRGDTIASMEALEELNEVRKENAKFRDAIGSLEIELALPPIPAADDPIFIDLLPNTGGRGYGSAYGSTATISTTWIAAFPIFFNNLQWSTSDWNNEYAYYIKDDESCVEIGSAIAGVAEAVDTSRAYKISKSTLDRLMSYYIEAGLMNAVGAEQAFTETAQRVARRHSIAGASPSAFKVISGKITLTSPTAPRTDLSDEIPF